MGTFPPNGPTNVLRTIPSYLYEQYADDDNLQAFVREFNLMTQEYVDWFNEINLPVYTGALIEGTLLDWVGAGLYGLTRPTLPSGKNRNIGPLNTYMFNVSPYNTIQQVGNQNYYVTDDNTYKRILTWHLFKGDGKVFNIRWLKRRVMRFLLGENGTSFNIDQTYQVSVSFGLDGEVFISVLAGIRTVTGGAFYNTFTFNGNRPLNSITSTFEPFPALAMAVILQAAVESGVLELPFQFTFTVNVS